jgi:hypothetical protein
MRNFLLKACVFVAMALIYDTSFGQGDPSEPASDVAEARLAEYSRCEATLCLLMHYVANLHTQDFVANPRDSIRSAYGELVLVQLEGRERRFEVTQ